MSSSPFPWRIGRIFVPILALPWVIKHSCQNIDSSSSPATESPASPKGSKFATRRSLSRNVILMQGQSSTIPAFHPKMQYLRSGLMRRSNIENSQVGWSLTHFEQQRQRSFSSNRRSRHLCVFDQPLPLLWGKRNSFALRTEPQKSRKNLQLRARQACDTKGSREEICNNSSVGNLRIGVARRSLRDISFNKLQSIAGARR